MVVTVGANVTAILAELQWTPDAADFDFYLHTPDFCPWKPIPPDPDNATPAAATCEQRFYLTFVSDDVIKAAENGTQAMIVVLEDELQAYECGGPCEWMAAAYAMQAENAYFEVAVTTFFEGVIPPGFTGLTGAACSASRPC